MLKTELLEIIANGENSGVEFKRDDTRPEQLAKEIVALVNFQGGRILLGVEDNGAISGLQRPDMEEWVMNVAADKFHPLVLPYDDLDEAMNGPAAAVLFDDKGKADIEDILTGLAETEFENTFLNLPPRVRPFSAPIPLGGMRYARTETACLGGDCPCFDGDRPCLEKMIAGLRYSRNTVLMKTMRDYGYVDYRGMGITSKVLPLLKAHKHPEPSFEANEDHLKTTLYRKRAP